MSIGSPALLALGLAVTAALAALLVRSARRRRQALARSGAAMAGRAGPAAPWLAVGGLAVLALAVAGPAASVPVTRAAGTVILAMDVSGSMKATDVAPTRLAAEQRVAQAFIAAQPSSVDIGVIAFEDGGLTAAVPSADHANAAAAVKRLQVAGGTSLSSAILASLSQITHRAVPAPRGTTIPSIGYWPSATIVLFSDGQDGEPAQALQAADATAEKAGVHVETVGVGTTAGTVLDVGGYHVFTALVPSTLQEVAQATGGSYHPASTAAQLNGVASHINLRLTVSREPLPLAGPLIIAALALLGAGLVLNMLRTGRVI